MNIDLSDKKAIVLLSIIVVLLAANIFLMMQPKASSDISLYKSFAQQTHSTLQDIKKSAAELEQGMVETPDMNAQQKAELALEREFYASMNADINWVSQKENEIYWEILQTQNPVLANELMRKEMAIMIVSNYVLALNNDAVNDGMSQYLDIEEAAEEARASLSWIEVKDLLNDDFAQEIISETLVQKQDIINETKSLMQEYLEERKKAFSNAPANSNAQYVEAMKLLELGYLLEINALPEDTNSAS